MVERVLAAAGKLACEDEMPGKMFALVEQIIIALSIFSDGLSGAKLSQLFNLI